MIAEIDAAVRFYNFERPHSALGGLTPWQRFEADETALRLENRARLRFALRHRKEQTIQASGVWKHGRWYWAQQLDAHVGDPAIVAWLRKDERTVDVYRPDGTFLCEAAPLEALTPAQVLAAKQRERERHVVQNRRLRASISKAEERYSPTNQPDGLDVVTISADPAYRDPDRPERADEQLLAVLGLTGGLYEPWQPREPPSSS